LKFLPWQVRNKKSSRLQELILMARSEAQKAADRRYRETHKPNQVPWTAKILPEERQEFDEILQQNNLGKTEFLRMAFNEFKKALASGKTWE
jgi:hypothetical protein